MSSGHSKSLPALRQAHGAVRPVRRPIRWRAGEGGAWLAFAGGAAALLLPIPETATLAVAVAIPLLLTILLVWSGRPAAGAAAVAGGALLGTAFPDLPFGTAAFVALVPLLECARRAGNMRQALSVGLAAGGAFAVTACPWGANALAGYTDTLRAVGGLLFLPQGFVLGFRLALLAGLVRLNRRMRIGPPLLVLPAGYVLVEALVPSLYPWFLGNTIPAGGVLSQLADLGGMAALSLMVMAGNVAAWRAFRVLRALVRGAGRERLRPAWRALRRDGGWFLLMLAAGGVYGLFRLQQVSRLEASAPRMSVVLVQPASPAVLQGNDPAVRQRIVTTLRGLVSSAAVPGKTDLVVFPESAAPMGYQYGYNPEFRQFYEEVAADYGAAVLTDNIHTRRGSDGKLLYWRGALLLGADGRPAGEYLKRRLVPFGEYVPLAGWLPGLKSLFRYVRIWQRGDSEPVLQTGSVRFAAPICFEVLDSSTVRRDVQKGEARMLVSQANDGWYRSTRQMRQHLELARYRSIENRRALVRVGNTGISACVSATGRLIGEASPAGPAWSGRREVPLPAPFSFYGQYGWVGGWLWAGILLIIWSGGRFGAPGPGQRRERRLRAASSRSL